jgi:hypothetical protein
MPLNVFNNWGEAADEFFKTKQVVLYSCLDYGLLHANRTPKTVGASHFRVGYRFAGYKPWSQFCGQETILVGLRVVGFLQTFYSRAVIQRTIVESPHFWGVVWWKRLRFVTIQPVIPTSGSIRCIFIFSGSELWSLFKYSELKLKNQDPIATDVLFKAYPMIPLSCRSNLAGRYLRVRLVIFS